MSAHGQSYPSETVLGEIPHLRAYARLMTNDVYKADHEVEETLKCATPVMDRMTRRSDLRAQLLMILRSLLIRGERGHWRDFNASPAIYEMLNGPFHVRNGHSEGSLGLASALVCLDFEDREAVVLTEGAGLSYREAAIICRCDVSVYRTRLGRGLARLEELFPKGRYMLRPDDATGRKAVASIYRHHVA